MREIDSKTITQVVRKLSIESNLHLSQDVKASIQNAYNEEPWPIAKNVLGKIIENYSLDDGIPICQDTGMACVFIEVGQEVHVNGDLYTSINEGVRQGYTEGYLRKSVVADPLFRENTNDNTPAMIYTEIVPGDKIKITLAPKGFGSENMSAVKMLKPADGIEGVKKFILDSVETAGPNCCPPIIVGVGIGGTFDKAALISKKALLRETNLPNPNKFYAELEKELLEKINSLGIGPQGYGGKTTALAVHIETLPTHIAGLPCAVNINCHVARHASEVI